MKSRDLTRTNIETLKESLAIDWRDYMAADTPEERAAIQKHLEWCQDELVLLMDSLREDNAQRP